MTTKATALSGLVICALFTGSALAQERLAALDPADTMQRQDTYVTSGRGVPVPTPRPRAASLASDPVDHAPVEVRRTADGVRMVGPVFFPEDLNRS